MSHLAPGGRVHTVGVVKVLAAASLVGALALASIGSQAGAEEGQRGTPSRDISTKVAYPGGTYAAGEHDNVVAVMVLEKPGDWSQINVVCSGALIGERTVVTAAHCVPEGETSQILVSQPGTDLSAGDFVGVVAARSHAGFKTIADGTGRNDIALLRAAQPLKGAPVKIAAPKARGGASAALALVGYGIDQRGSGTHLPRWARLTDLSGQGGRWYGYFDPRTQVVAGSRDSSPGSATACGGDSGGPLYVREKGKRTLFGVVGYGAKDCSKGLPSLFMRAGAYRQWVRDTTGHLATASMSTVLRYWGTDTRGDVTQGDLTDVEATSVPGRIAVAYTTGPREEGVNYAVLIDVTGDGVADYVVSDGTLRQVGGGRECPVQERTSKERIAVSIEENCLKAHGKPFADLLVTTSTSSGESDTVQVTGITLF